MGGGNVPGRCVGGGIGAHAEVDARFRFAQGSGEIQIGGGIKHRIRGSEKNDVLDRSRTDVLFQSDQVRHVGVVRFQSDDCFAEIAQGLVHCIGQCLESRRGARASEHQRATFRRDQVGSAVIDPFGDAFFFKRFVGGGGRGGGSDFPRQRSSDADHFARFDAQTMVGHAAGEAEYALHGVKAVHFLLVAFGLVALSFRLATIKKRCHRTLGVERGKIAIERQNAVGLGEISHHFDPGVGGCQRLIGIKLRRGIFRREFFHQSTAGRRFSGTENEADFPRCGHQFQCGFQLGFGRWLALMQDRLRTNRRIHVEDRSLREGIGAIAVGMQRVRSQFGRTSFEARHHQRSRTRRTRHRSRIIQCLPGNHPLRGLGVGDRVFFGATASRHAHPGEGR